MALFMEKVNQFISQQCFVHSFVCVLLFTEELLRIDVSGVILDIEAHEKWFLHP